MDESNPIDTPPPTPQLGRPGGSRKRGLPKRRFTQGKKQKASDRSNQKRLCHQTKSSNKLDGLADAPDVSRTQPHQELCAQQMGNPPINHNFIHNAQIEVIEVPTQLHLLKGAVLYVTIASFYEFALLSPPDNEWSGTGGTIKTILLTIHLSNNKVNQRHVQRILQTIVKIRKTNESATHWMLQTGYDPAARQGRPPVISLADKGSVAVLHQAVKTQLSLKGATALLNRVLRDKGRPTVSESAVRGAVGRMGGQLVPKGVRAQGSTNVTDKWSRARYGIALQLLMRARAAVFETPAEAMEYFRKEVPRYLQKEHNRNNNKWERNNNTVSASGDGNGNENGNDNANNNTENNNFTDESTWPACFQMPHVPLINWDRLIFVNEKHLRQKIGGRSTGNGVDLSRR